jgi:predicted secreted protein
MEPNMRWNKIIISFSLLLFVFMPDSGSCATRRLFTDPSKPIEVKKGEDFILAVDSNATTGYAWTMVGPFGSPQLKYIGTNYQAAQPGMVGQGGVEWFRFLAMKDGETEIYLRYGRSWEKDKPPAKEAKFKVKVS